MVVGEAADSEAPKESLHCMQGVSWAVQNGCVLSRAKIRPFKHNDMADLRRVLQKEAADHARQRYSHEPGSPEGKCCTFLYPEEFSLPQNLVQGQLTF